MDWIGAQFGVIELVPSESVCDWLITPQELSEQYTNPTLMVTRAVMAARHIGEEFDPIAGIGFGLIEWSGAFPDDQFAPSPCPHVFFDSDYDWILRQIFPVPVGVAGERLSLALDMQYMSQAKRRLETGNGLLMVFSSASAVGFASYDATVDVRCLIKE
jgi:hypothetical protein